MILNLSVPKQVNFEMELYVTSMVSESEAVEILKRILNTPAGEHISEVEKDWEKLSKDKAQIYHHMTAKALYLCKRAMPDIQTGVAFLSTRVKELDEDDWKILIRLMGYLKGSIHLALTLKDNGQGIKWLIDAAHAVHHEMKGHTGVT